MTALTNSIPIPTNRWKQRLGYVWRTYVASGDITTLLIAFALLLMPLFALRGADWPIALRTTIPALAISILIGFLLARSHYNELFALIMNGIYGLGSILLIASINESGGLGSGVYGVFTRITDWLVAATSGGVNQSIAGQDDLVLTLLAALLFWFLGYNITWHTFRADRIWRAILPPGLILTTNNLYYAGNQNLDRYLIAFSFLAMLMVVRSHLEAREWNWYVNGIAVPRKLRRQFFLMGALMALIALIIAWGVPSRDVQERLDRFQTFLQQDPITNLGELWSRLFTTVDARGPTTADYYGADSLQLGGAIQLGEDIVMAVSAPQGRRYYWRSRVFDTYDNGRWTPAADTRLTDDAPLEVIHDNYLPGARVPVQQQFVLGLNASRLVYTAPQPLRVELPTRTDLRYTNDATMNVSVIRPQQLLRRGDTYTATSLMSNATASQLRTASAVYPEWVNNLYLYVSPSITERTRQLARDIVADAGAVTVYDRAKSIETWLRTNITYNEQIPAPPRDRDPVDWVLFDLRQGYCNYYATSMISMLRSLGIPSRMAAGFAQGEWDTESKAFIVRERDAHTWVEVYFPEYGWIEFEPTAAQAPLTRVDDTPVSQQPDATPVVTATPTFTPTPTPTATPEAQVPPPDQEGNSSPATPTPTAAPSPTATPVILPPPPPPTAQSQGLFDFLLPAIGLALLGLFLIVLIIAGLTLLWWWWEWRGMKGLSPVTRAYARLERYLGLLGIHLRPQQTPEERRRRIIRAIPGVEPPITAITRMYSAERYGPPTRHQGQNISRSEAADEAWAHVRVRFLQRALKRLLMPWQR